MSSHINRIRFDALPALVSWGIITKLDSVSVCVVDRQGPTTKCSGSLLSRTSQCMTIKALIGNSLHQRDMMRRPHPLPWYRIPFSEAKNKRQALSPWHLTKRESNTKIRDKRASRRNQQLTVRAGAAQRATSNRSLWIYFYLIYFLSWD